MRRHLLVTTVTAAAVTLTGSALAAGAGGTGSAGAQLWVARYHGPAFGDNEAQVVAVDPGGRRVYVTGHSYGGKATGADYATVAYSAATGQRLWVGRFAGNEHVTSRNREDIPTSMAVSPGGRRVFVTGRSHGRGTGYDYATVTYAAATGRRLWVRRYNFAGSGDDFANAVAVSPDGTTVYVTGDSSGDYATIAYRAVTGRRLWVRRHGLANRDDDASSVAVSPDGITVYVTGSSQAGTSGYMATVAYSAATGRQLWVRHYRGPGGAGGSSVAVSRDGTRVFATGDSWSRATSTDYATVAYRAADGRLLWASRYNDAANQGDGALSMAMSPDGARVFVTGYSYSRTATQNYVTVAFDAVTGRQLWVSRYHGPEGAAESVAVSPGGTTVYVTGSIQGRTGNAFATVAYRAADGTQLWARRHNGDAWSVAVSPDGTTVFATGFGDAGYVTVAYRS
jgi:DNA-binding beta-propeller fold protein YncE